MATHHHSESRISHTNFATTQSLSVYIADVTLVTYHQGVMTSRPCITTPVKSWIVMGFYWLTYSTIDVNKTVWRCDDVNIRVVTMTSGINSVITEEKEVHYARDLQQNHYVIQLTAWKIRPQKSYVDVRSQDSTSLPVRFRKSRHQALQRSHKNVATISLPQDGSIDLTCWFSQAELNYELKLINAKTKF